MRRRKTDIDDATETADVLQQERANRQAGLVGEEGPWFDAQGISLAGPLSRCRAAMVRLFGPGIDERLIG